MTLSHASVYSFVVLLQHVSLIISKRLIECNIIALTLWLFSSPSKKPKKVKAETTAGSGAGYKSKEFISDNEASSSDSDDRPLVKKETKKESDSEVGEVRRSKSMFYLCLALLIVHCYNIKSMVTFLLLHHKLTVACQAVSLDFATRQWRRQRSKGRRSFRGQNILKPGHPDALLNTKAANAAEIVSLSK